MTAMTTGDIWLSTGHAAEYVGVHPQTLKRYADQGLLSFRQYGPRGYRRFRRSELDRFIRSHSRGVDAVADYPEGEDG